MTTMWRNVCCAFMTLMVMALTVTNAQRPCPSGRYVSCIVEPCRFATCAAFRQATCRNNYCEGCNAEFWENNRDVTLQCDQANPSDQIAPNQQATPGCNGRTINCLMNPCHKATCLSRPSATCSPDNCNCLATFWEGSTDVTDLCSNNIDVAKQNTPRKFGNAGLLSRKPCIGRPRVQCQMAPCSMKTCERYPDAECRNNYCGDCEAEFWNGQTEVTNNCSTSILSPNRGGMNTIFDAVSRFTANRQQQNCPNTCLFSPCHFSYCAAFPQAECRYDTCQGCTAQFYVGSTDVTLRCNEQLSGLRRLGGFFSRFRRPRQQNYIPPWFALLRDLF